MQRFLSAPHRGCVLPATSSAAHTLTKEALRPLKRCRHGPVLAGALASPCGVSELFSTPGQVRMHAHSQASSTATQATTVGVTDSRQGSTESASTAGHPTHEICTQPGTESHTQQAHSTNQGAPSASGSQSAAAAGSPEPQRTGAAHQQQQEPSTSGQHGGSGMAGMQQNFNAAGVSLFLSFLKGRDRQLVIPHLSVESIASVNWAALKAAGFKGVVFDKDNTLSEPYAMEVLPRLRAALAECKRDFGSGRGVALYSNSAGLHQFDPQGEEARALEAALGVTVLRHTDKKPAGGKADMEAHFGCAAHELVMVGDRYLTDIVFGNRHGMLTIRPAPLTTHNEPAGVRLARKAEDYFVARWMAAGVRAPAHKLLNASSSLHQFTNSC